MPSTAARGLDSGNWQRPTTNSKLTARLNLPWRQRPMLLRHRVDDTTPSQGQEQTMKMAGSEMRSLTAFTDACPTKILKYSLNGGI
jgi:hypothetical protein